MGISLNARSSAGPRDSYSLARAGISALLDDPAGLILTKSCTSALQLAAIISEIGPGDEVIVPSFTHPSTANAFLACGATVKLADVTNDIFGLDPQSVERLRSARTKAIVPVHYAGVAGDIAALQGLAEAAGAVIIEDAAHGIFARNHGTPLGRLAGIGALSFHRTKNLSAGSGGALVVSDERLLARSVIAADKGSNSAAFRTEHLPRYEWIGVGIDGRMDPEAAEALLHDIEAGPNIQTVRHHIWDRYKNGLSDWAVATGSMLPVIPRRAEHPAHIFHVRLRDSATRDRLQRHCATNGVEAARHYVSLADSHFGRSLESDRSCPTSSGIAETILRLPLHHELTDAEADKVLAVVSEFVG